MRFLLWFLPVLFTCLSCKKDNTQAGEKVEIYLLKTFQAVAGKCQVDAAASTLQDVPVIRDEDILAYSPTDYQFKLTNAAMQKVKAFADFTPFAVTVDGQVIYYGFFKPGISSSSCGHSITMDINWTEGNRVFLRLGYPGQMQGVPIDDQRNNAILITTLRNQGKLM